MATPATKCFLVVEGGLGKHFMAIPILRILKNKYDKVYVLSGYSDVFSCISFIDGSFQMGDPSVYRDIVMRDDCDVFWKDPYNNSRFIKKKCHLYEAWAEELGIDFKASDDIVANLDALYSGFDKLPYIYPGDVSSAKSFLADIKQPIILLQFYGGQSATNPNMQYNASMEGIKRNYPVDKALKLIELLRKEYPDHALIGFSMATEPDLGIPRPEYPYMTWTEIVKDPKVRKIVTIDSSLQHIAASVHHPDVTVIWGETRPEHFGHHGHKHVLAEVSESGSPYFRPMGYTHISLEMPSPEEVLTYIKQ